VAVEEALMPDYLMSAADCEAEKAQLQAELQAAQEREKEPVWIKGECPRGCGETLFVGEGGYVTCSFIDCPEPDAPHKALAAQRTEEVGG